MLAALPIAKAEVREFYPSSSAAADVQFVYSPDQRAPDSWLALVLRKTGVDIWFLLMRDAFLMDSFDYPSQTALLGSTLSAGGEATHSRRAGGCDNVSPSEQVSCELERDLLDAGWSDPGSNTFGPLGDLSSRFEGDAALFGTVRGGISFGNFTKFAFYANAFAPNAGFDDGDWLGSGPGGEFSNPADLTMSFSPVLAPASVPEIPIPVMLLIGAAALSLAATLKNFGERPIAGS